MVQSKVGMRTGLPSTPRLLGSMLAELLLPYYDMGGAQLTSCGCLEAGLSFAAQQAAEPWRARCDRMRFLAPIMISGTV